MLTGAKYQPPGVEKMPGMIGALLESLQTADQEHGGFTAGVYAHWALARIHPFADGNGRMARIMQDWIFLRNRLVPAPISFTLADEYYAALQEADGGRFASFIEFVALAALKSLARYQSALDAGRETEVWIDDLAALAGDKTKDQESALYLNWSQRMAELRETFESVAEKLRIRLAILQIRFTKYGGLDLQGFRRIKNQGTAPPTWDFGLEIRDATRIVKCVFGYVMHTHREGGATNLDDVPVLSMSELQNITGEPLSLREIAMQAGEYVRVRQDLTQPSPQFDAPITAHTICRDFFQDVLRIRFGIG